jgi:hypothetical protein
VWALLQHERATAEERERDGPDADCRRCTLRQPLCPRTRECDVADRERGLAEAHGLNVFLDARRAVEEARRYPDPDDYPADWPARWRHLVMATAAEIMEGQEREAWVARKAGSG